MKKQSLPAVNPTLWALRYAFAVLFLTSLNCSSAYAAVINVPCTTADLIAAINAANDEGGTNPGPDVLNLTSGCTYTLTAPDNDDNGLPVITSTITINGNTATIVRDIVAPRFRIFEIAALTGNLTLNELTLQAGRTPDAIGHAASGGAIYNNGILTVNNCTLRLNRTGSSTGGKGGFGGAIYNSLSGSVALTGTHLISNQTGDGTEHGGPGGAIAAEGGPTTTFTIHRCLIEFNGTGASVNDGGQGAGVFNNGPMTITESTIRQNTTGVGLAGSAAFIAGGNSGYGGGIHNQSMLDLFKSTISANFTGHGGAGGGGDANGGNAGFGAGVYNSGALRLANCTLFNNVTGTGGDETGTGNGGDGGNGGGISSEGGTVDLTNVTFSSNVARLGNVAAGGGENGSDGQGHSVHNLGSVVTAKNTIFSATTLLPGDNCSGVVVDGLENLQFLGTTCVGTSADPKLEGLGGNGGPTETVALMADSPAIDNGNPTHCSSPPVNDEDQRSFPRPVDGNGDMIDVCDIGAFEFVPTPSNGCVVCHKGESTLTLPCNSLDYRRHLDHGDATGPCATPPGKRPLKRLLRGDR